MPECSGEETPGKVAVKREPGERRGFARNPEDHYCWQVDLINKVVSPPWTRCFGSLGTGFVGVRPDTASSSSASCKPKEEPAAGAGDPTADAATGPDSPLVPSDASIIIFVNAPAAPLQTRGGRTIDGYKDALDRSQRTLEWSAQRSDKNNKRIEAIIAHRRAGGRVVVGVRSPVKRQFRLLGEVTDITTLSKAAFLVDHGDHVIQERGTRNFHKVIGPACLNNGLRSGVGLTTARFPVKGKAKWCSSCCYAPPKALLHFGELQDDGVAAFQSPARTPGREAGVCKKERLLRAKLEAESLTPAKRLRCKTSPDEVIVKVEKAEPEAGHSGPPVSIPAKRELPEEEGGLISVKLELPEDPPEDMSPAGFADDGLGDDP